MSPLAPQQPTKLLAWEQVVGVPPSGWVPVSLPESVSTVPVSAVFVSAVSVSAM